MGLDVYLYRYDDFHKSQEKEKKYSDLSDELWNKTTDEYGSYENIPDNIKETIREALNKSLEIMELGEWGQDEKHKEQIEVNSKLYPDHYFKIGYFRSSYNSGGINNILRNLGLPDLHEIFEVNGEDYYIQPNWKECLERTNKVMEDLKKSGGYRIHKFSSNVFAGTAGLPRSEAEALSIFRSQIERDGGASNYNYSNKDGEFFMHEPLEIVAIIPGMDKVFARERECVYAITKPEDDNQWYYQALEIVKETIEYVLAQDKIEQYYLHWSG